MSPILGTAAPLISDLSLITEDVVLALLFISYFLVRRGRIIDHHNVVLAAVVVNAVAIGLVMIPSLILGIEAARRLPLPVQGLAIPTFFTIVHVGLGSAALIAVVYVVARTRLMLPNPRVPEPNIPDSLRGTMQMAFVLWLIAIFFGNLVYALLYV